MAETTGFTISDLSKVTSLLDTDLIEIDRSGAGYAITYGDLVSNLEESLGLNDLAEALDKIIG